MSTDTTREPRGFGEHARGPAAEKAHEMGWDLNEDTRTAPPGDTTNTNGGTDYNYGARDFGDDPVNMNTEDADTQKILDNLLKED